MLIQQLEARGYEVKALEKFGHDPAYPVTSNWPHLVRQLADFASLQVRETGRPAYLVGHSLGGFLSLMCAAQHPNLGGMRVAGVVLLDSPLIGGWKATAVRVAKGTGLVGTVPPGAISRKRKNQWPGKEEASAHFGGKKIFALWEQQVLQDYIEHGTHNAQDDKGESVRQLSFDRKVETAIYNTLPHNLERILKRHPLQCPVEFIGGQQSVEIKQAGMALTEKVTQGRITLLKGSHLFPMESPGETAALVEAALLRISLEAG